MENFLLRQELLLGKSSTKVLKNCHVAVFGVGGVGSYALETLVRSGIENFDLYDGDVVSNSNINRQIIALSNNVGCVKVEVARDRILQINPKCKVNVFNKFLMVDDVSKLDLSAYSYVIDAIDTISTKIALIERAKAQNVLIISAMGAGNKLNPANFKVCDIYSTSVCPVAKILRHELKLKGIKDLKVVYSDEKPIEIDSLSFNTNNATKMIGSVAFVPSVMGIIMASEIIKDLLGIK